jgi:hypothetical protein
MDHMCYTMHMPSSTRTTVILDEPARLAAKTLATKLGITPSEAIRQALIAYRDQVCGGVSESEVRRRSNAFSRLTELMDGNDAESEIARLKREDDFF